MTTRILIWSPNYAPELTGIPPLVTEAAEWLAARGHRVEVVTPMPNYPERRIHEGYRGRGFMTERRGDVTVHRSWLRVRPEEGFVDKALYELTASTVALPQVLRRLRASDVVVCVVPTLLAAAYATHVPRRPRVVLWVQDLVVAGAAALEAGRAARAALTAANGLERRTVRRADRVVVCSPGFRDHFVRNGLGADRIDVVYNWVDNERIVETPPPSASDRIRVLYSGNLGYSQGFSTLVDAASIAGDAVAVDIVGAGNAARAVAQLAEHSSNVTVQPPVPDEEYPRLLSAHDVHVVLQRRISAGANLPSKIATYLASGRPIVGSVDPQTPAAELLRESGGALLVEPESPQQLADGLLKLGADPGLRLELGRRSRRFAESRLDKETALQALERSVLG